MVCECLTSNCYPTVSSLVIIGCYLNLSVPMWVAWMFCCTCSWTGLKGLTTPTVYRGCMEGDGLMRAVSSLTQTTPTPHAPVHTSQSSPSFCLSQHSRFVWFNKFMQKWLTFFLLFYLLSPSHLRRPSATPLRYSPMLSLEWCACCYWQPSLSLSVCHPPTASKQLSTWTC